MSFLSGVATTWRGASHDEDEEESPQDGVMATVRGTSRGDDFVPGGVLGALLGASHDEEDPPTSSVAGVEVDPLFCTSVASSFR